VTTDLAISLATAARWTVTGTSERRGVTTLYLKTPLGRAFQLTFAEDWTEEHMKMRLEEMRCAPF